MNTIPKEILSAVNALLAPYGVTYTPQAEAPGPSAPEGFVNWKGAIAYTGLSRSTLQRAVKAGKLVARKLNAAKQGVVVFAKADLDRYIYGEN